MIGLGSHNTDFLPVKMQKMKFIDADEVKRLTPWAELITGIRDMFAEGCKTPPREHYTITRSDGTEPSTLLTMPAWIPGENTGVKIVTVTPANAARNLPAVAGLYILFDGNTGLPQYIIDGTELTVRRTAAASALAASYLAPDQAKTMALFATGRLSLNLVEAHAAIRPIERVIVVKQRSEENAKRVANDIRKLGFSAEVTDDPGAAVRQADIVSCATLATEPIVHGDWFGERPAHIDLVGAFKTTMCEADAALFSRADTIVVDTFAGALAEGGDLVQAIQTGAISKDNITCDLAMLVRDEVDLKQKGQGVSIFKSVGASLEDLAAARLIAGQKSDL